jgi:hypothetical protein
MKHSMEPSSDCYLFHVGFFLGLFFHPEDGGDIHHQNVCLVFKGLHAVISQKIELFTTTAVRISYPTFSRLFILSNDDRLSRELEEIRKKPGRINGRPSGIRNG